MPKEDVYEVYAIQYAYRADRKRYETFITNAWTDPLHDADQPISYYVWAIVNAERTIVVDTGFDADEAARRRSDVRTLGDTVNKELAAIRRGDLKNSALQSLAGQGVQSDPGPDSHGEQQHVDLIDHAVDLHH